MATSAQTIDIACEITTTLGGQLIRLPEHDATYYAFEAEPGRWFATRMVDRDANARHLTFVGDSVADLAHRVWEHHDTAATLLLRARLEAQREVERAHSFARSGYRGEHGITVLCSNQDDLRDLWGTARTLGRLHVRFCQAY